MSKCLYINQPICLLRAVTSIKDSFNKCSTLGLLTSMPETQRSVKEVIPSAVEEGERGV